VSFTSLSVYGTARNPDQSVAAGATIQLKLSAAISDGATDILPAAIDEVSAGDGTFTFPDVTPNDDSSTTPTGTYYRVLVFSAAGVILDYFNTIIPHASAPSVNLFSLARINVAGQPAISYGVTSIDALTGPVTIGSPDGSVTVGKTGQEITLESAPGLVVGNAVSGATASSLLVTDASDKLASGPLTSSVVSGSPGGGPTAWVTATAYTPNDLVSFNGLTYLAVGSFTSGATFAADLAAGHWSPFGTPGLPAGIVGASAYNPALGVYNLKGNSFRRLRAALAKAVAGTGLATILCAGDSITWGNEATSSAHSYPMVLRGLLSALGIPLAGTGFVNMSADGVPFSVDSRYTFSPSNPGTGSSHWNIDGFWIVGIYSRTNGDTVTFVSDLPGTSVVITYSDGNGPWTYNIDGAGPVTVTPGSSFTNKTVTITGLANTTHTIVITNTATGAPNSAVGASLCGIEVVSASGARVINLGSPGSDSSAGTAGWQQPGGFLSFVNKPTSVGTTSGALAAGTEYASIPVVSGTFAGVAANSVVSIVSGSMVQTFKVATTALHASTMAPLIPILAKYSFPAGSTVTVASSVLPFADLTVFMLGNNDSGSMSAATFLANMLTINSVIQQTGSDVLLMINMAPATPADGQTASITTATWLQFRQALYTIADAANVPVLDLTDLEGTFADTNYNGLMYSVLNGGSVDGAHPNNTGYAAIAQAVRDVLVAT
jgi:lysophospholipase L1-like esterase